MLKGFLGQGAHCQERSRGQVTSCILGQPALAPALAVKIDAAYRRYFLKGFCCLWLGWGAGQQVFGVKLLRKSIAARILSSHVHVSTLRRTWSTQKLIFTGLASGGIITLE